MTRRFRNAVYQIEVKNPGHVSNGVQSVKVDGRRIDGDVIPVAGYGKTHKVEVIL